MAIQRNDVVILVSLVGANLLMGFFRKELNALGPIGATAVQVLAIFGIIGVLFFRNMLLTTEGAKYHHFKALIFPSGVLKDIAVKKDWRRQTKPNKLYPQLYETTFEAPVEIKLHDKAKPFKKFHVTHLGTPTARFETCHGIVDYKGEEIESDNVVHVVLYENEGFPISQEKSIEEPNFILINAPKADQANDYMKYKTLNTALGLDMLPKNTLMKEPPTVRKYVNDLRSKNERLVKRNVDDTLIMSTLTEGIGHFRSRALEMEGKNDIGNQELAGVIELPMDVEKSAVRQNQSQATNIRDVLRLSDERKWYSKYDWKWIMIGIIGIVAVLFFWANPKAVDGIAQAMTPSNILVGAIFVGAIGFVLWTIKDKFKGGK